VAKTFVMPPETTNEGDSVPAKEDVNAKELVNLNLANFLGVFRGKSTVLPDDKATAVFIHFNWLRALTYDAVGLLRNGKFPVAAGEVIIVNVPVAPVGKKPVFIITDPCKAANLSEVVPVLDIHTSNST